MPVIGAYHCLTSQPIVGSYTHRYTTFGMASAITWGTSTCR